MLDWPRDPDLVPVAHERMRIRQQRLKVPAPRVDENKTRMRDP